MTGAVLGLVFAMVLAHIVLAVVRTLFWVGKALWRWWRPPPPPVPPARATRVGHSLRHRRIAHDLARAGRAGMESSVVVADRIGRAARVDDECWPSALRVRDVPASRQRK